MRRRSALLLILAGAGAACASPAPPPLAPPSPTLPPTASVTPATPALAARSTGTATPSPPAPTARPTATPEPGPTVEPTQAPAATEPPAQAETALPQPGEGEVVLDIRLLNGQAEVQLDGRTVEPGEIVVPAGTHQVAALAEGDVVALADTDPAGGRVDVVVPPPQPGLAVMVENQADARPQTGLTHADVVYEVLAEGGITRFLAVFLTGDAPVLGPVRSLRHYYAFLAGDYGADIVHIGASPLGFFWRDVMELGKLDESAGDPGVYRVRARAAPHNAYTDTAADRAFLRASGHQASRSWGPLRFSTSPRAGDDPAGQVRVSFRPWAYWVDYTWSQEDGVYLRSMEGVPHLDAQTGERIAPTSVVVQYTTVEGMPDDPKLRIDVDLVGADGPLHVFSGGAHRQGAWFKGAPGDPTVWLDADGQPLLLPPGQVWVEIVPFGSPLGVS